MANRSASVARDRALGRQCRLTLRFGRLLLLRHRSARRRQRSRMFRDDRPRVLSNSYSVFDLKKCNTLIHGMRLMLKRLGGRGILLD